MLRLCKAPPEAIALWIFSHPFHGHWLARFLTTAREVTKIGRRRGAYSAITESQTWCRSVNSCPSGQRYSVSMQGSLRGSHNLKPGKQACESDICCFVHITVVHTSTGKSCIICTKFLSCTKSCYESRGKQDAKELTSLATWQVLLQEDWLLMETSSHAARG